MCSTIRLHGDFHGWRRGAFTLKFCRDEGQQKQGETTKASFLGDLGVMFNLFIFLGLHKTIIFHGFWGPMQFVFLVGGDFGGCIQ